MAVSPLRKFIEQIETNGALYRISAPVNPVLEIATITDRISKKLHGGKALLFEHPMGSHIQIATNLFGSADRVCQALGITSLNELTIRLSSLLSLIPKLDFNSLDRQISVLPEFSGFTPSTSGESDPALTQMHSPNIHDFPFLQCWPGDGAAEGFPRYITLPQVITVDPNSGMQNCGIYRVQIRGEREVAIQWKAGSGAARHADLFRRAKEKMPVAIVLGGDPAVLFSAMFPLPGDVDEIIFAGFLRGTPLDTALCRSIPIRIPTGAELVIEGYVEPDETVTEGPFGNHTGFYTPAAPASLMRVSAISCRHDAIIPATVVGPPPMEDCWMAQAWERLLLAFLQKLVPSIKDIHFPMEWVFHQSAIITLEIRQPGMVRSISSQLWALPWFKSAKILLFVTVESGVKELPMAAWRFINVTDFSNDIYYDKATGRVAIDATGNLNIGTELKTSALSAEIVASRWKEYGLA
jgi:4-hydroxy-3-polyprenylbenzoate decarboxylase